MVPRVITSAYDIGCSSSVSFYHFDSPGNNLALRPPVVGKVLGDSWSVIRNDNEALIQELPIVEGILRPNEKTDAAGKASAAPAVTR